MTVGEIDLVNQCNKENKKKVIIKTLGNTLECINLGLLLLCL